MLKKREEKKSYIEVAFRNFLELEKKQGISVNIRNGIQLIGKKKKRIKKKIKLVLFFKKYFCTLPWGKK